MRPVQVAAPVDPSAVRLPGDWAHRDIHANGLRFHVVEDPRSMDDHNRQLVLFLHGFAEFWWAWRRQLAPLASVGLRPVAVDMRGYGDSDKPPRGYDAHTLASDAAGLVRSLGHSDAVLVGHAEGGLISWATAALRPAQTRAVAVVSAPHPLELRRAMLTDARQVAAALPSLVRHQIPRLAERSLRRNDGEGAALLLRERSGPNWRGTADFAETERLVRMAVQIPKCAHLALEYQRWAFRSQFRPDGWRFRRQMRHQLRVPGLLLRGSDDPYVLRPAMERSSRWLRVAQSATIPGSGHYAHQENPDAVTEQLLAFLGSLSAP
ncbi:alpha/beta hydrolase fold protein [Segniliparus rotundus DSM 44985]|uniref:Alpha/beta hydrolase fold protein n=1 Tax=Segniliparus rotundus (strain ATCC BAA-972 / CDC 1076 / CIP 108378 / DSM 44985 / JCM 13578) TaxID=640132 RepID=D6ZF65_SEGRD|nr:alpha/beta hydrolase [Segniliparus rotundus]ADG97589.1 alpha/beta hydrolase fold protein [Segniliparus rotundus DSM 44985]